MFFGNVAIAQIQVFPTQVVLSEKIKSSHVTIRNSEDSPMRYQLTFKAYRKDGQGKTVEASLSEQQDRLASQIKFSPKEFLLQPGKSQVVRILLTLKNSEAILPGHLHLHISPEQAGEQAKKSGFVLQAKIAAAVPIVVLNSAIVSKPEFGKVSVDAIKQTITVEVKNDSDNPLIGNLMVFDQKNEQVAFVRGLAIYDKAGSITINQFTNPISEGSVDRLELHPVDGATAFTTLKKAVGEQKK